MKIVLQLGMQTKNTVNETVKGGKIKFTQQNLRVTLDSKTSMISSPSNITEKWSKEYALLVVLLNTSRNMLHAAVVHL